MNSGRLGGGRLCSGGQAEVIQCLIWFEMQPAINKVIYKVLHKAPGRKYKEEFSAAEGIVYYLFLYGRSKQLAEVSV